MKILFDSNPIILMTYCDGWIHALSIKGGGKDVIQADVGHLYLYFETRIMRLRRLIEDLILGM